MFLACVLVLLVPATVSARASASDRGNIAIKVWTEGNLKYVTFNVLLRSPTDSPAPGVSVTFTDCRAGLGLPVGPEPVWSSHNAGTLQANKLGNIQWDVDGLPPLVSAPLRVRLRYAIPRHSVPYSVCLRANFIQFSTDYHWSTNMRFFLKPAKPI
jgi:hypothetical protein